MPTLIMPKMGDGMEEGTLLRWLKQEGEEVEAGEPIAEIETDKVSLEIEAQDGGTITKLLVDEGTTVPIGTPIARIGEDGTEDEAAAPATGAGEAVHAAAEQAEVPTGAMVTATATRPEPVTLPAPTTPAATNGAAPPADIGQAEVAQVTRPSGERLRASPLVKRLAAEHGLDLRLIQGTGPGGRIVKDDVMPYVRGEKTLPTAAAPAAAPVAPAAAPQPQPQPQPEAAPERIGPMVYTGRPEPVRRELSRVRRLTGERMAESKRTIPHFYVTSLVDMAAAAAFREQINGQVTDEASKVTFNDLIVKAAALALRKHPDLNASFEGGELYDHPNIDINVAVALDGGLIAPFVKDADQKSLGSIARTTKDLINRAKNGGLMLDELQGGTFTISNLGMLKADEFIAVINPPQAAILAVGAITQVPVVENGEIKIGQQMKLTVSADHRAADGAEVARFLQTVRSYLENPMTLALG